MRIGVGIFLIAVGAILTFAVHATVAGIDIHAVGIILMVVGLAGLIIDLAIFAPRRRSVTRRTVATPGTVVGETVTQERIDGTY